MPYPVLPAPPIPYFQNNPRLVDLMVRQGDSRAAAIRQQGQDSAQLWNTVGQGIASTVQNTVSAVDKAKQQKIDDAFKKTAQDTADLKLAAEKKSVSDDAFFLKTLQETPLITDPATGAKVHDLKTLSQILAQGGVDPSGRLQHVGEMNAQFEQIASSRMSAMKLGADKIVKSNYNPAVAGLVLDQFHENGVISDDDYSHYKPILNDPATLKPFIDSLASPAKIEKFGPGEQGFDVTRPGSAPVISVPEKATPTSLQSENVLYQGKPIQVTFDPHSGKRTMVDGAGQSVDVTGKTSPIPRASSQGPSSATDGGLSPEAVDYVATQYRILGPSGMPTRLDENQKIKVLNNAAKQVKALGQTPAVAVQRQAAFKSDGASLTKMTTMKSSAEAFETKANAQAGLVGELSSKVGRTQFPIVNDVLLSGKERIGGDENTHLFSNALLTFTTEYAKIMEGSTGSAAGSSEGARKDAARLISIGLNNGTIQKTIAQMQWEMRQTIQGYDVTIEHITERMGGTAQPAAPAAAPRIVYDMNGNVVK